MTDKADKSWNPAGDLYASNIMLYMCRSITWEDWRRRGFHTCLDCIHYAGYNIVAEHFISLAAA